MSVIVTGNTTTNATKRIWIKTERDDGGPSCSFCGKRRRTTGLMVHGPSVYICNDCVDLCNEVIAEERTEKSPAAPTEQPSSKLSPEKQIMSTPSASPAPPTMTGIHQCAMQITIQRIEDAEGTEYTGGLREVEAVVRSLASKTHALVPLKEGMFDAFGLLGMRSVLSYAIDNLNGKAKPLRQQAIRADLVELVKDIDRWLSTPLPSEKDET